jgi:hypothetical protein
MKQPLPRILSAVPQTPHVRFEIAKAIRTLIAPDDDERLLRQIEPAALRDRALIAKFIREIVLDLRKAGFDPDEPRVPAGNSKGGQWTTVDGADDLWGSGPEYAASNAPGPGHNQGPPLDEPPPIPTQPPAARKALNTFINVPRTGWRLRQQARRQDTSDSCSWSIG